LKNFRIVRATVSRNFRGIILSRRPPNVAVIVTAFFHFVYETQITTFLIVRHVTHAYHLPVTAHYSVTVHRIYFSIIGYMSLFSLETSLLYQYGS